MNNNIIPLENPEENTDLLTALLRVAKSHCQLKLNNA